MRDDIDAVLRSLAERQYGVFSRTQATDGGADRFLRSQRVSTGRWVPVGAAAYRMAGAPVTWRGLLLAAHWDAGPRSLIARRSAAQLFRWPGFEGNEVDVLVPRAMDHVCTIATISESRRFDRVLTTQLGLLPVVAPADTMVHLAPDLGFKRLEWLIDDLAASNKLKLERLQRAERELSFGCKGMRPLRAILKDREPGQPVYPDSALEKLFTEVVTGRGLPAFQRQVNLPGRDGAPPGRVDFLWPDVRIIVEVDGRRWHTRVQDFERDAERRLHWLALGYATAPITWAMLTTSPDEVCADLLSARNRAA